MYRNTTTVLIAAGLAAVALNFPAFGEDTVQAAPSSVNVQKSGDPVKDADDTVQICRREEVTGSRLGARKTCRTRREWAEYEAEMRNDLNRAQTNNGYKAVN